MNKMPSRAATSALAFAVTCCMLGINSAFVVQAPTMSTNENHWAKKNDAPNKVPVGGAVGFGQGHAPPHISGFAAGNVMHLPRVPSPRDHAAHKRSRGSSCPPLELGAFEVFRDLSDAAKEFKECFWDDRLALDKEWEERGEYDAGHNELKKEPHEVEGPKREIVTTTAEEEVVVQQEEQEEEKEGMVQGQEKGEEDVDEDEDEEGVVEVVVVMEDKKGPLSWVKKRVLTAGGGGGVPAVPEHEWPLPGLVAVEGGPKKRPPLTDTDTQAITGWLDDGSDQHSPMPISDPEIVHKAFRDPSYLQERSQAAYHSLDSSTSTTSTSPSTSSPSEGSSSTKGGAEKEDAAAAAAATRAETEAKGSEGEARAAGKAGQRLKMWWGGVTRRRLR